PGTCRSNHEVHCALAKRLGAFHRGFDMTAMEIIDETLRSSGWPGAAEMVERRWVDAAADFRAMHFLDGFGHPDGKFRFSPDWAALGPHHHGLPTLPDYVTLVDDATADRPFRLVAAPARQFLNTTFTETPGSRRREVRPTALIHPDDASRLGLTEGGRVRLGNARGEVVVHARLFDGLQPGVVVVESVWPNEDFDGGAGINVLTGDDPVGPNGGAAFHDTAVWMRAVAAEMPQPAALAIAAE
ncbi:MAG: molybdopterin oxidoreductase family protein, partial [Acetobacteraceae bacterium]|nr:molybdopterin oxidoreductase family protein [Acetobacteraceae bacterium]